MIFFGSIMFYLQLQTRTSNDLHEFKGAHSRKNKTKQHKTIHVEQKTMILESNEYQKGIQYHLPLKTQINFQTSSL